jgi:hypothetical protein
MITKSKEKVDQAKEVISSTTDSFNNPKNMGWLMAEAVDDIYALFD